MKRRGNRRYYQHHEVLLIRRIRELLYDQGFTISGARNRLSDAAAMPVMQADEATGSMHPDEMLEAAASQAMPLPDVMEFDATTLRGELMSIRSLLTE